MASLFLSADYPRAGIGGSLTAILAPQEHHKHTTIGLTSGSSRPGGIAGVGEEGVEGGVGVCDPHRGESNTSSWRTLPVVRHIGEPGAAHLVRRLRPPAPDAPVLDQSAGCVASPADASVGGRADSLHVTLCREENPNGRLTVRAARRV
jgi:hypothetical protein